jgi:hypothetical protein
LSFLLDPSAPTVKVIREGGIADRPFYPVSMRSNTQGFRLLRRRFVFCTVKAL